MSLLFPSITVEIGFGANVLTPLSAVTWTDVSQYFRSYDIQRGRQRELQRFDAGTLSLVLDNSDNRFDPQNTSSPYYPNVVPMSRVRVKATWLGVTYTRFVGYINAWPNNFDLTSWDATVTINATDAFKVFNLMQLALTSYSSAVKADAPDAYYTLGDAVNATTAADSSTNNHAATVNGRVSFGIQGPCPNEKGTAAFFDGGGYIDCGTTAAVTGTSDFSVELFMQPTAWAESSSSGAVQFVDTSCPVCQLPRDASARAGWSITTDSGGHILFQTQASTGSKDNSIVAHFGNPNRRKLRDETNRKKHPKHGHKTSVVIDKLSALGKSEDSQTERGFKHFVCVRRSGVLEIWEDGNVIAAASGTNTNISAAAPISIGTMWDVSRANHQLASCFAGIAHVAIWKSVALTQTQIQNHYNAAVNTWDAQTADQRVGAVLDAIGWASADRNLASCTTTIAAFDSPGSSPLEHIQKIEEAEWGAFFMGADGRATLLSRHSQGSTPLAVFSDDGNAAHIPYSDIQSTSDETDIWTEVHWTRKNASITYSDVDSTHAAQYGNRMLDYQDVETHDDTVLLDHVENVLAFYAVPRPRWPKIVFKGTSGYASGETTPPWTQLLARELGDRVQVQRKAPGASARVSADGIIESLHESYDVNGAMWTSDYMVAPVNPALDGQQWVLGDATNGVLGSTTVLSW